MKISSALFLLLFMVHNVFPQEKQLHGQIFGQGNAVEGINIVNLVNERSAISNEKGEFYIMAKPDDMLVFSALNFEYKRKIITAEDMVSSILVVNLVPKSNELDEVVITKYEKINSVDLGILSKPAKQYTVAERRLYSSTSGPLDILINMITGRTKSAIDGVEIERKEMFLEKLDDLYEVEFYTQTLRIQTEYVNAFKYYCVDNKELRAAVKLKNKTLSTFLITQLAADYNKLQELEKKSED